MNIITNPSPTAVESSLYFGSQSGANRGADMYIRSVVMEAIQAREPAPLALGMFAMAAAADMKQLAANFNQWWAEELAQGEFTNSQFEK